MAVRRSKYDEIDQALKGNLAEFVLQHRASGMPWRKVAIAVTNASGVDVTGEALRQWVEGRAPLIAPRQGSAA